LTRALAHSVVWGLRPHRIRAGQRGARRGSVPRPETPEQLVAFFERHATEVDFHLRDMVGKLYRPMRVA